VAAWAVVVLVWWALAVHCFLTVGQNTFAHQGSRERCFDTQAIGIIDLWDSLRTSHLPGVTRIAGAFQSLRFNRLLSF
jgi:hypothetical protein